MSRKPIAPKKKVQICVTCVWIGALIALLSRSLGQWCLWVGLGIVVLAATYRYCLVRCPHCGYKLVDSQTVPSNCPRCGESLE